MQIHVTFTDAETGLQFAETDLQHGQLPANFEAATTLHLGGADWKVVSADPVTATEYCRSGALRLVLRRIVAEQVVTQNLLYSLPTVNDWVPGVVPGSSKLNMRVLEIHEDDWRQQELVATDQSDAIEGELAAIRKLRATERTGPGFRRVHIREGIREPLANTYVTLDDLTSLKGSASLDGVAYLGVAGLLQGAFAIQLGPTCRLYGLTRAERVITIGMVGVPSEPGLTELKAMASKHSLVLVDWLAASLATW